MSTCFEISICAFGCPSIILLAASFGLLCPPAFLPIYPSFILKDFRSCVGVIPGNCLASRQCTSRMIVTCCLRIFSAVDVSIGTRNWKELSPPSTVSICMSRYAIAMFPQFSHRTGAGNKEIKPAPADSIFIR